MRKISRFLLLATVVAALGVATPAEAAPKKTLKSTIMLPMSDVGVWFGAGYGNFLPVGEVPQIRQSCAPGGKPGQFDGYIWRFFDLKGQYNSFLATGPKVMFGHDTPAGVFHDYDIDIFLFDDKCKRIVLKGVNGGGGIEKASTKKPASYAVIVYWYGHQPNLPVTLEVS